jgi:hypothetical protein
VYESALWTVLYSRASRLHSLGGARFFAALKIVCALERAVFADFAVVFLAVSR